MKSIRGRLVLTYLLILTITLGLTGIFFQQWMSKTLTKRAEAQLVSQSDIIAHFLEMYVQHPQDLPNASQWLMKEFPDLSKAKVSIYDGDHNLIASNYPEESLPPSTSSKSERTWSTKDPNGTNYLHSSAPVTIVFPVQQTIGKVVLSSRIDDLNQTFLNLRKLLWTTLATALLVGCLIALFLAKTLSQPIDKLRDTADRIAQGDLSYRSPKIESPKELSRLSRSINFMAHQLQAQLTQVTAEQGKTKRLLASLPDPVIAFDHQLSITYLNPVAQNTFHLQVESQEDKEASGDLKELQSLVVKPSQEGPTPSFDLELGEQLFKVYQFPFMDESEKQGTVLILRDITDIKRLEQMRNLFLGTVSHELRTPLTIIKGFAATLQKHPENPPSFQKPLRRINDESDRLTRLVNKLLDLSTLRSQKVSLQMEPLIADAIVEETVELLRVKAERKEVHLSLRVTGDARLHPIIGDQDRLKQVFLNLIDNAIKFTPEKGEVQVVTDMRDYLWSFSVIDNGPGIPKESLKQLFEYFYRAPNTYSARGVGLGLAITKEIVGLHSGEIEVESEVGEGTTFRVTLPAPPEIRGFDPDSTAGSA